MSVPSWFSLWHEKNQYDTNIWQVEIFIWNIFIIDCGYWNWGSIFGVVTRLLTGWLKNYDLVPSMATDCAVLQNVYTSTGVHPASCSVHITGSIHRYSSYCIKLTTHLHPVAWWTEGSYTSAMPCTFMVCEGTAVISFWVLAIFKCQFL
jgi:hypothetical protein